MHLISNLHSKRRFIAPIVSVLIFLAVILAAWMALSNTQERSGTEQSKFLKDALRRASVTCYAIEGRYPPSLDYIVDNYGVVINNDKFIVKYSAFAENLPPTIRVLEIGKEAADDDESMDDDGSGDVADS